MFVYPFSACHAAHHLPALCAGLTRDNCRNDERECRSEFKHNCARLRRCAQVLLDLAAIESEYLGDNDDSAKSNKLRATMSMLQGQIYMLDTQTSDIGVQCFERALKVRTTTTTSVDVDIAVAVPAVLLFAELGWFASLHLVASSYPHASWILHVCHHGTLHRPYIPYA